MYVAGIDSASDGSFRTDYADPSVPGHLSGHLRARFHHADHRNIDFFFQRVQRIGAHRITGHYDGLYLLRLQESHNLFREARHRFPGFASVGHPGRIPEIYNFLIWDLPHDLPHHGQPANA